MPAIITHDTFGREVYGDLYEFIGGTRDEADAFLLGNQGPDPLFYSVVNLRLVPAHHLGSIMHAQKPSELLVAFHRAMLTLPGGSKGTSTSGSVGAASPGNAPTDYAVGRAYVMGFLCHYLLDSTAHPFIYSQQYAFCDAGVEGLTRKNGSDVHALIESELDELVLTTHRDETIATFNPSKVILKASAHVLDAISSLYVPVAREVYDLIIPADTFKASVRAFRTVQGLFYSPSGLKHNVLGRVETLVRPYSFYRAMSHRNRKLTQSAFDNHEHRRWEDPYTHTISTSSFEDLFGKAKKRAETALIALDAPTFDIEVARLITRDLNFSGEPTCAQIIAVEDAQQTRGESETATDEKRTY